MLSTSRILLLLLILMILPAYGQDCNGSIEYIGDVRVLNLWGTWSEMGYAHGYLLGPDIATVFHDYFLEMVGGPGTFENARLFYLAHFDTPSDLSQYAQGILSGIADTVSIYSDRLGRDLDYIDICVVTAIPDIVSLKGDLDLLCSSVSSWGAGTETDSLLNGAPAISRNLDYYVDTGSSILDNSILITFDPASGQEWVSVGFPGFAGSLSGMNQSGVSACLNMGNHQGTTQYTSPFVPICMALALGLSEEDFNGSGTCDPQDMIDALTQWNRGNSYAIHVVGKRTLAPQDSSSVVVELSNRDGTALRYAADEAGIAPCRMILTNHHRVLIPPVSCYRYSRMMDSLTTNPDVTLDRLWGFMGAVGWPATPGSGGTIQTMVFMPEQLEMGLAFATASTPSYQQDPEWIAWNDIFPNHTPQGLERQTGITGFTVSPNPSSGSIYIGIPRPSTEIIIYDVSGRRMDVDLDQLNTNTLQTDLSSLPAGIYSVVCLSEGQSESLEILIIK